MGKNTPLTYTEQDLVRAFCQGKPEAIDWLYDKYAAVLLGLITRIMRNQEVAEAVLQDTFVNIWQQKDSYDASRLKPLSWLILIARDTAMAALKSGKYNLTSEAGKLVSVADQESTIIRDRLVDGKIIEYFSNLEPTEKTALDLIYLKGYSCTEAAAALQVSEETVKAILRMACKHLRAGKAV